MTEKLRWAILGTGKIGNRFAEALNHIPEQADLLAVGSRRQETADAFGEEYGIPRRYDSYKQAANDPDVDIVYIGTPGVFHLRDVRMCLQAGKHVLCEKALAVNAQEAEEMIALAREKQLFLMEAMWTRFFPIHVRIRELLSAGAIGKVNGITIQFIAQVPEDINNRFFRVDLGAGVLLDTASYGISWASSLFGPPEAVTGLATFGESGCDYQTALALRYSGGQLVSYLLFERGYTRALIRLGFDDAMRRREHIRAWLAGEPVPALDAPASVAEDLSGEQQGAQAEEGHEADDVGDRGQHHAAGEGGIHP